MDLTCCSSYYNRTVAAAVHGGKETLHGNARCTYVYVAIINNVIYSCDDVKAPSSLVCFVISGRSESDDGGIDAGGAIVII